MSAPLSAGVLLVAALGGCMAGGDPEASRDLVAAGEHALLSASANPVEGWHGWAENFDGAPANVRSVAMARGPIGNALEVFAVTSSGTLYHNFLNDSGWHGWQAGFDWAPTGVTHVALAQGPINGALEVFLVANGTLYHNFLNDSGWHGWQAGFDWAPTGVTYVALAQGPINGALEVFLVANGTLYHNFLNSSGWHGWEGSFNGAPSGISQIAMAQDRSTTRSAPGGPLQVLAVASGTLYNNYLDSKGWHGWVAMNFPAGVTSVAMDSDHWSLGVTASLAANGVLYGLGFSFGRWGGGVDDEPQSVSSVALLGSYGGTPYLETEYFAVDSHGTLYRSCSLANNCPSKFIANFDGAPPGVTGVWLALGPSGEAEAFAVANGKLYHDYFDHSLLAPSNVRVTFTAVNALQISWTDNSSIEGGYHILYPGSATSVMRNVSSNATSAVITSLLPSTTYCFGVQAYNSQGVSPPVTACGTTLALAK